MGGLRGGERGHLKAANREDSDWWPERLPAGESVDGDGRGQSGW